MRRFTAACLLTFSSLAFTGAAVLSYPAMAVAEENAPLPKLPEATSSFGAATDDGWLYVYGGHIAPTHNYFKGAVSGQFHRIQLAGGTAWEKLPEGPALQGLNLAAHAGKVYRVGGMEPRNEKGSPTDNHSLSSAAVFDSAKGKWEALPDLPHPRSSHDTVVLDGKLYIVGGWNLAGKEEHWNDNMAVLDLSAATPAWTTVPQPFRRRALMAAAYEGKLYVVGGMDDKQRVLRSVSIYDPKSNTWTDGPNLPAGPFNGFAPAVAVHGGQLYASVAGGKVLRLDTENQKWDLVTTVESRIAHRMVSDGKRLMLVGGAAQGGNLDEVVEIPLGN